LPLAVSVPKSIVPKWFVLSGVPNGSSIKSTSLDDISAKPNISTESFTLLKLLSALNKNNPLPAVNEPDPLVVTVVETLEEYI